MAYGLSTEGIASRFLGRDSYRAQATEAFGGPGCGQGNDRGQSDQGEGSGLPLHRAVLASLRGVPCTDDCSPRWLGLHQLSNERMLQHTAVRPRSHHTAVLRSVVLPTTSCIRSWCQLVVS
jgi:hypothetical protein